MIRTNNITAQFYLNDKTESKMYWYQYLLTLPIDQRKECFSLCFKYFTANDIQAILAENILSESEINDCKINIYDLLVRYF